MIITENNQKSGFLLINKQTTWTSFDVVAKLRNITKIKKIGHAGTLDPFADGLLIVAIGRESTKQIDTFVKKNKEYITTMCLGAISDTFDTEGKIKNTGYKKEIKLKKIEEVIKKFIGTQQQTPPMYSAKKINGQKLYKLARLGKTVKRQANTIEISNIEIIKYSWPELTLKINCGTGTYIRSLGNDIGEKLKCGAYLTKLQRTSIGEFKLEDAHEIKKITPKNWEKFLIPSKIPK